MVERFRPVSSSGASDRGWEYAICEREEIENRSLDLSKDEIDSGNMPPNQGPKKNQWAEPCAKAVDSL